PLATYVLLYSTPWEDQLEIVVAKLLIIRVSVQTPYAPVRSLLTRIEVLGDVLAANSASVQNPCRQMLEGQEANLANFSFFFSVNGSSFLSCSSDIGAIVVVNAMRRREEDRRLVVLFYRESEGLVVLQLHG